MSRYVYGFRFVREGGEVFFRFRRFPEIITSVASGEFARMIDASIQDYAHDAVLTALQSIVALQLDLPEGDDPRRFSASGFVQLTVREAMKLELYRLYRDNCGSVAEFARHLGKPVTAARRLLDLRHHSRPAEIEQAVEVFGKRLVHDWGMEQATPGHARHSAH